jgi:hypothetical protein
MTKQEALEIVINAASEYLYLDETSDFRDSEKNRQNTPQEIQEAIDFLYANQD